MEGGAARQPRGASGVADSSDMRFWLFGIGKPSNEQAGKGNGGFVRKQTHPCQPHAIRSTAATAIKSELPRISKQQVVRGCGPVVDNQNASNVGFERSKTVRKKSKSASAGREHQDGKVSDLLQHRENARTSRKEQPNRPSKILSPNPEHAGCLEG